MSHFYTDPTRETDPYALPDAEVFHSVDHNAYAECEGDRLEEGWYWRPRFPGCLLDDAPIGPFETEGEAIRDAQAESEADRMWRSNQTLDIPRPPREES